MKMNKIEYYLMTFDLSRYVYLRGIVRKLRDISGLAPGKRVLEIGCGNGVGTRQILEFFQPGEFIATEYDRRLVEITKLKNKGSKVMVEEANAADLRFANDEFDAVIGLSVIHHIPNWKDCVGELHRVIKPNGLLIIEELSIETFSSPFGRLARGFVSHPYASMFTKKEFLETLDQTGFEAVICQPHSMMAFLKDFFLVARKAG
jgi:ubiquinone/menaquinone biosynthesis C-methylase UbiE